MEEESMIPESNNQVICINAVKQEMSLEFWESIVHAPVKRMLKALGDDVADVSFVAPPWGRSSQKNMKCVAPEQASTVQFHARINSCDLRVFLRASGNGAVHTCPKTEDKKISSEYLIVWLKVNVVEMAVHLSQCENHFDFGLVRSFKGDSAAKGIRFAR
jgi:hypothetical protein